MQQMNYWFHTVDQALEGVAAIRDYVAFHPHADALLTILAAGIVKDDMERLLKKLDDELPHVARAGISEFLYDPASDDRYNNRGICMNLMLSDAARFKVLEIPCELGSETDAAIAFAKEASQTLAPRVNGCEKALLRDLAHGGYKLVAAIAVYVLFAKGLRRALGKALEHAVSRSVSKGVVVELELVYVAKQDKRLASNEQLGISIKGAPILNARELVANRDVKDSLVCNGGAQAGMVPS